MTQVSLHSYRLGPLPAPWLRVLCGYLDLVASICDATQISVPNLSGSKGPVAERAKTGFI
jgi:hypothetical protein